MIPVGPGDDVTGTSHVTYKPIRTAKATTLHPVYRCRRLPDMWFRHISAKHMLIIKEIRKFGMIGNFYSIQ